MENRFLTKFDNIIVLSVRTKNVDRFLTNLYKLNIDVFRVDVLSYKEIIVEIYEKDFNKVRKLGILNKIDIVDYKGMKNRKNRFIFNRTLIFSLCFGFFVLMFLSNIIFSIEIKHTSGEIRTFIMNELNSNGIRTLQFRKSFKELEKIKNNILDNNKDKLEWLEIDRIGTKYVIKLEERKINNYVDDYKYQDIISTSDAVIKKIVATNGVKVKEVNEYVKKGETVISGSIYLNEELKENVKATGEVYGEVWYKLNIEYPIINDFKEETGNKKSVTSINFLNKSFILFNKNNYKNSYVKKEILFENNILPISISKDTIYEQNVISGIYTEGEALLNARDYAKEKMQEMLDEDEYIISDKVLKYNVNSNTIYMDVFYKIYANITGTKEIIIEEGE